MENTDLRARMICLRLENNLTQSEVAKLLDLRTKQYIGYETGITKKIPVYICIKLVKIYNVSCDYLLGRKDIRKPYDL